MTAAAGGSLLGHLQVDAAWLAVAAVVAIGAAYAAAVGRLRRRGRRWKAGRLAAFSGGLGMVGLALSPAVEAMAAADARGHMAQHLLLGLLGPVALVWGAPITLLLGSVPPHIGRRLRSLLGSPPLRVASHIATATALSTGGMFVLYLTPVYALSQRSAAVHTLVHAHLLVSGALFAWIVAGPDPMPGRPSVATRVGALVVAGGLHGFLAKLLYSRAAEWPPGGGWGVEEAQAAARWMYYGGHLGEALLAVGLFSAWYRRRTRIVPSRWGPAVEAAAGGPPGHVPDRG